MPLQRSPLRRRKLAPRPLMPLVRGAARPTAIARSPRRPAAIPGVMSAGARQQAAIHSARQRALADQIARVTRESRRLTGLIQEVQSVARQYRPIVNYRGDWPCVVRTRAGTASEHWSKGLQMQGGPKTWSSPVAGTFRGKPEAWMQLLLQKIESQKNALDNEVRKLERQRVALSGLGEVTHSESSPLLLLILGVTAGYLVFNAVTT